MTEDRDAAGMTEDERAAHEIVTVIKNDAQLYATYRRSMWGSPNLQLSSMALVILEVGRKYKQSGWTLFTLPQLVLALNILAEGITRHAHPDQD